MVTVHVGNNFTRDLIGDLALLGPADRIAAGCGAQRLVWFARHGDILILPFAPADAYLEYVTALTGTPLSSMRIVVPPEGSMGPGILTPDRLANPRLWQRLRAALGDTIPENIFPFIPDASVVALARSLNAEHAVPGHRFFSQGGAALVNSKVLFRAIAAGIGIKIAPGTCTDVPAEAEDGITELLTGGYSVIVKREYDAGAQGNEILVPTEGVQPSGAARIVQLPDRDAVRTYLATRWDWLTAGGRHRFVIERYYQNSLPVYAEFRMSDSGVAYSGHGEVLMAPLFDGLIIPAPTLTPTALSGLNDTCRRLCEAYLSIGYRGTMSVDGIVTPDGEILLHEINGRVSGGTHLHDVIGRDIVGEQSPGQLDDRVLLERGGWAVPSFSEAVHCLEQSGLGYDQKTRSGVILVCDFGPLNGTVRYCVVSKTAESARKTESQLLGLFAAPEG
jgi:hypothetical protein